ncbi:STAS domain-containing protein [Nocardia sp. NPDC004722]
MPTISISPSRLVDEVPAVEVPAAAPDPVRDLSATQDIGTLDCVVVRVAGELDVTGLETFRRALAFAFSGTVPAVVVDLRRTRFLSLRNAVVLAEAIDTATVEGISTHVLTQDRRVARTLEVTGVDAGTRQTVAARWS